MTKATTAGSVWKDWALGTVCIVAVLAFLFRQSFDPAKVLFANDAPLGLISSQAGRDASTLVGVKEGFWQDLNWVGIENPSVLLGPSLLTHLALGSNPVHTAKFAVPVAFLFLGISAFLLFRVLGFGRVVCILGALAAALNMNSFSHGAWGLPSRAWSWMAALLAIAALCSGLHRRPWIKAALAGMAVGIGVLEGFDVGALYSLYVAAFAIFLALIKTDTKQRAYGILRVGIVAVAAGCFAAHALSTLIGTQITGVGNKAKGGDTSPEVAWDGATMWSLPKVETLRVIIPGLFGYRMDTPGGGAYWGNVGHSDLSGLQRHSGAGEYAGILVVLIGIFGAANAFRKTNPTYNDFDRRVVKFWMWAAIVSILFAWGRYAPFYQFLYKLPFFSTIRNPIKFMHFFHLSLLILFGYGLQVIFTCYITSAATKISGPMEQFKSWWAKASPFDRRVVLALAAGLAISLVGFLGYTSSKTDLTHHLEAVGFPATPDPRAPATSAEIAAFSQGEVGEYLLFYTLSLAAILLCLCGFFSGKRARWAGIILGAILVIDMARANKPWITYLNYKEKYMTNAVFDFLRKDSVEHRVTMRVAPFSGSTFLSPQASFMQGVFGEWLQNQFQYYNIQSPDIIQMSRVPDLDARFRSAFMPRQTNELFLFARFWQLSNTRYILGQNEYLGQLNGSFDPELQRFRIATNFDFAPKPGHATENLGMDDLTWVFKPDGRFSIFEFTGASPRYKLYSQWRKADDDTTLAALASRAFNPDHQLFVNDDAAQTVTNSAANLGKVTLVSYAPKRIEAKTETTAPSILLWNDRWSPNWKASVDGQPVNLLRCNFIMRGIQIPAGTHQIKMEYAQPGRAVWLSFATAAAGLVLLLFVGFDTLKNKRASE
jgi:hypothetical protein